MRSRSAAARSDGLASWVTVNQRQLCILNNCLTFLKAIEFKPGDRVIDDGGWTGTIQSIHPDGKKASVYLDLMESVHPVEINHLFQLTEVLPSQEYVKVHLEAILNILIQQKNEDPLM